ncbi:FecR domain-containing protein [Candidatus Woesearchaeota archaeon]|nr:FecR domain-containing protein [Candidatus Woesearchaeota archaeon]
MRGWKILLLVFFVIILFLGGILAYFAIDFLSSPTSAEISEFEGFVEYKSPKDSWKPAFKGTKLSQRDEVRTIEGKATILLFGGSILRLDDNTTIEITSLTTAEAGVKITQKSGRTWNRVIRAGGIDTAERISKISGLGSYELKLPSAVATVRGTAFSADSDFISVVVGSVAVKTQTDEKIVSDSTADITSTNINIKPLTTDEWIKQNIENDNNFDKQTLQRIKEKYPTIVNLAKKKYGLSDNDIDNIILDYIKKGGGPTNVSIDDQTFEISTE